MGRKSAEHLWKPEPQRLPCVKVSSLITSLEHCQELIGLMKLEEELVESDSLSCNLLHMESSLHWGKPVDPRLLLHVELKEAR